MKSILGTFLISSTFAAAALPQDLVGVVVGLGAGVPGSAEQTIGTAWHRCVKKLSTLWWGTKSLATCTAQLNCKGQSHKVLVSSFHACPWDLSTLCHPSLVPWITEVDSIAQGTGFKFCEVLRLKFLSPYILRFSWPDPPSTCPWFQWEDSHGQQGHCIKYSVQGRGVVKWDLTFSVCQDTWKVEHYQIKLTPKKLLCTLCCPHSWYTFPNHVQ